MPRAGAVIGAASPALWRVENYRDFLAERRALLAEAANGFLDSLLAGTTTEEPAGEPALKGGPRQVIEKDEEAEVIREANEWVVAQGLSAGVEAHELVDEAGTQLAMLDLARRDAAWADRADSPAPERECRRRARASANGFCFFTSVEALRRYVKRELVQEARGSNCSRPDLSPRGEPN